MSKKQASAQEVRNNVYLTNVVNASQVGEKKFKFKRVKR